MLRLSCSKKRKLVFLTAPILTFGRSCASTSMYACMYKMESVDLISCGLIAFSLRSGILDTRRMLDDGMKIGLGTGRYCIDKE